MSVLPPESRHTVSCAAGCDVIVCYGGAKVTDKNLASTVHCIDDGIIGWLQPRKQCRLRRSQKLFFGYESRIADVGFGERRRQG
jgi:hypothetical protein